MVSLICYGIRIGIFVCNGVGKLRFRTVILIRDEVEDGLQKSVMCVVLSDMNDA